MKRNIDLPGELAGFQNHQLCDTTILKYIIDCTRKPSGLNTGDTTLLLYSNMLLKNTLINPQQLSEMCTFISSSSYIQYLEATKKAHVTLPANIKS